MNIHSIIFGIANCKFDESTISRACVVQYFLLSYIILQLVEKRITAKYYYEKIDGYWDILFINNATYVYSICVSVEGYQK